MEVINYRNGPKLIIPKLFNMTFGTAIDALKNGLIVRRKEWNETKFVIKQIPAHINEDIIPNMQSLPSMAKKLILNGKGFIDYQNQCLIYNEINGTADSWFPTMADIFAEDWEVVS